MSESMAAMLDRLREAAAAHDKPVGSSAAVPVGPITRRSADAGNGAGLRSDSQA
jgi:hypothetical protein